MQMTLNHPVKVNEMYYMRQDFTSIEMTMPTVRCSRSTNGWYGIHVWHCTNLEELCGVQQEGSLCEKCFPCGALLEGVLVLLCFPACANPSKVDQWLQDDIKAYQGLDDQVPVLLTLIWPRLCHVIDTWMFLWFALPGICERRLQWLLWPKCAMFICMPCGNHGAQSTPGTRYFHLPHKLKLAAI